LSKLIQRSKGIEMQLDFIGLISDSIPRDYGKSSVCLSLCAVSIPCSFSYDFFLQINYMQISRGASLSGVRETTICPKKIIPKFQLEYGWDR